MIYQGKCKDILKTIKDNSYTGILTDAPYGLSFMGKKWDYDVPDIETFKELLRVTKSGGYLLCFAGSRTQHRMAVNIEDAGWIIKDTIMWIYGSGFPKSHNLGKAIDSTLIVGGSNSQRLREIEQTYGGDSYTLKGKNNGIMGEEKFWDRKQYENQTNLGSDFNGHGTALKPSFEPIIVAMKPCDGTYAENAINHGVAGLNIDECRVGTHAKTFTDYGMGANGTTYNWKNTDRRERVYDGSKGRWPANLIHDGSPEVVELFPDTGKSTGGRIGNAGGNAVQCVPTGQFKKGQSGFGDSGSAARFFYCAKASKTEKNAGIEIAAAKQRDMSRNADQASMNGGDGNPFNRGAKIVRNHHPTVKPIALMEYLAKLLKMPENTKLLDPFMGSGTTLIACERLGIECDGMEMNKDYIEIAKSRLAYYSGRELEYEIDDSQSEPEPKQLTLLDYLESV